MSNLMIKEFVYNVPVEQLWQALTHADQLKKWYFPQIQKFEPVVGYEIQFDDDQQEYQKKWIVTKIIEGRTFSHSWAYQGYPGTSEVTFDLFANGHSTKLRVTHTGLDSFANDPHFYRERFDWGWDNLLGRNLKELLEGGHL